MLDFLYEIAYRLKSYYADHLYRYHTTESMSENSTSGQIPTHRRESSPAPAINIDGGACGTV